MSSSARLVARIRALAPTTGSATAVVGALALAGWAVDRAILRAWGSAFVPMNPATAVAFVALGIAVFLEGRRTGSAAARALAVAGTAIGVVKLAGLAVGVDPYIDSVIFASALEDAGGGFPNRMAPNTAALFVALGTALIILPRERFVTAAQGLAIVSGLAAVTGVAGYAYEASALYGVGTHIPMALNTAVAFLLLAVGTLCLRPRRGLARTFTEPDITGILVRRLLPAALVVPLLLGWLRALGQGVGLFDQGVGIALFAMSNAAIFALLIAFLARLVGRADRERRVAERELERRLRELDAVNRELESFSYAVSHDLRAPLRSIAGFSQALAEDCGEALDDEGRRHLERIESATRRMAELIDGLLELSRITRAEVTTETVDLASLGREIVDDLSRSDPHREVDVAIASAMHAVGDRRLLRVAVQNLLGNAWKFTAREPAPRIEFGTRNANGDRVFYVRDNGAGFDMAYADKLFSAFQRLHAATDFDGTGIGLATVNRIVHRHGGRIWAEGTVGDGAAFYFTLGDTPP